MASASLPAPGAPALVVANRALLTIAVMAATLIQVLDATIANVALPHMQATLGATQDSITWVLTSYIVASAIAIPITGWLSDRIGQRTLFLTAVAAFIGTSMLCGIASSLEEMVAFRIAQGIAGAFITPLSQTVMLDINPPERHGKAMSIWGMGVMIGPILGPVLGGWLTENFSWRWVFYVNLPIGALAFAGLWALLPPKGTARRGFDLVGFSLLALAIASFQLMLDRGQQVDWFDAWEVWIEAGVAASAAWMLVVHLWRRRGGLFDPAIFANRNLVTGFGFIFLTGMLLMSGMALLPPLLQRLFNYPVIDTGLLLAPRGIGVLFSMWLVGQFIHRVDPRLFVAGGFALTALSLWQMTGWSLEMDWHPFAFSGLIQGVGLGLLFVPLNVMAFATLDGRFRTDAASLLNLFRNIGSSVGISIVTALLARNVQVSHADLSGHVTASNMAAVDLSLAQTLGRIGDSAVAMVDAEVNRQAAMIAYLDDFRLLMLLSLAAIPLVLLLKPPKRGGAAEVPHAVME